MVRSIPLATGLAVTAVLLATPISAQAQTRSDNGAIAQPLGALSECPVDLIRRAYEEAANATPDKVFSTLATSQDVVTQCARHSALVAKLFEANNRLVQQVRIAADEAGTPLLGAGVAPPIPNCTPVPVAEPVVAPAEINAPETGDDEATAISAPARPAPSAPTVSCARGYEVIYTAGTGSNQSALIQRRDDQWHVVKGFALPGGVTIQNISPGTVTIDERGETHTLPAAAASAEAQDNE